MLYRCVLQVDSMIMYEKRYFKKKIFVIEGDCFHRSPVCPYTLLLFTDRNNWNIFCAYYSNLFRNSRVLTNWFRHEIRATNIEYERLDVGMLNYF